MPDNIILIGFMAVGKGRTARALSQKTGMYTIDTDDLIESLTNSKIKKIFADKGEQTFRILEKDTAEWIRNCVTNTIISTGGGFFMVEDLKSLGTVVYLHSSVEAILNRLLQLPNGEKKIQKRPLLQDLEQAKALYSKRLPMYRAAAHFEINAEGKTELEIVEDIVGQLP